MSRKHSVRLAKNDEPIAIAMPVGLLEGSVGTSLNGRKVMVSRLGPGRYRVARFWKETDAIADRVSPEVSRATAVIVSAYWLGRGDWTY